MAPRGATQKQLDEYLTMLEEAKKRDHRIIGKQLDLFSFHDEGPGFAFLHPKGMVIWNSIIDFWRKVHRKYGYQEIKTPIMLNESLWHRSGHWDNYKENMYFTTVDDITYAIKPMNCPGGCLVYKSRPHSYKEFPMRIAELGLVHRYEASGVMHGLVRVRQFTQDDAHIFCTPEMIEPEVVGVINLVFELYKAFGFEQFTIELSTKPEKHIGSDEIWDVATNALKKALEHKGLPYKINEGDGAFYGPKIDFHIRDGLNRPWQLGTIQLDFSMPQRFELTFTDKDNTEKTPVMIHRAILGSLERFIGILIEHYGGNMPLWLSPEQMRILTISEKSNDYAKALADRLTAEGFRCGIDLSDEKVNSKIVRAHAERIPYMLVVGPKEAETDSVNVRIRGLKDTKTVATDAFVATVKRKVDTQEKNIGIERRLTISKQTLRINEKIRISPIRLIDDENNQAGVIDTQEALAMAREAGLDLVEVSPGSSPPVCRIMDYGKFLYEQKRKEKLAAKKQHSVTLKEIRLRPEIDVHDKDIKVNHAKEFLEKGHKVQFTMMFRGREMMHQEHGYAIMKEITESLESISKIERPSKMLGRRITLVLTPK